MKKLSIKNFTIILLLVFVLPVAALAQPPRIVPDCSPNCGYADLFELVGNIIEWIVWMAVPVSAGVFAWAGIIYMTTAVSDKKAYAKSMMWKVFWGLVFILAAWLIVTTITNTLLDEEYEGVVPVEGSR